MLTNPANTDHDTTRSTVRTRLIEQIKAYYRADHEMRRGVCLLNAGKADLASKAFRRVAKEDKPVPSLPSMLAACLLSQGDTGGAAAQFKKQMSDTAPEAARIRFALSSWQVGDHESAINALREGISENPNHAELHFQLGTLLATIENYDEAELRFTQAITIDRDHSEALVSLALCCGVRNSPQEAIRYLQKAQAKRRHDARIGLLLAQAAKAAHQRGQFVRVRADMPPSVEYADRTGIEELSRVIEADPDFVDAFLSIPSGEVNEDVFALLLRTIELALERAPEHAELHYHCGRVLDRLGRREDAISLNERAVALDPLFTRALIELGTLYRKTDRSADATSRLEQAVAAGADYADVHYLLGNLYLDQGLLDRAKASYRRALHINDGYHAALEALNALTV